jgi:hypothetical protein
MLSILDDQMRYKALSRRDLIKGGIAVTGVDSAMVC